MGLFSDVNETEIPFETPAASKSDGRFRLISTLISSPDRLSEGAKKFKALEDLIKTDFLRLSANIGIPGESALYAELLEMLADLREVVEFPHLANKNVLAVGGEFSAGKSCFLNSVFGMGELLPTGVNPTTSIPTFLTNGEKESIRALNTFNRTQILTRDELNSISHAFNDDAATTEGRISFYHILKLLQVETPAMRWANIAFLDTPGYSKPHSEGAETEQGSDAGNTDEEKAREHLGNADYLIWVVGAKDGTFQQQGISFLKDKVKWKRPLYLLINKADQLLNEDDVKVVYDTICQKAEDAGFILAGSSAFSSRTGQVFRGDNPEDWFNEIDKKCKYTRWRGRFKQVIDKVVQFNRELEQHCASYEMLLNRISVKEIGLTDNESEQVRRLKTSISQEKKKHADTIKPFIAFCEKVEIKLDETLAEVGVKDEQARDVGLEAVSIGDAALLKLKKGDIVKGTVEIFSRFSGCYIKSPQAQNQILVRKKDMEAMITNPEKTFTVGRPVELTVYEVSSAQNRVILTIKLAT